MPPIRAILFDKDGTLFDFQATWGAWARTLLQELSAGDDARAARMAAVMAFDTGTARFRPESPVIAGTGREVADLLAPLCGQPVDQLERRLSAAAAAAPLVEAAPLRPLLAALRAAGLRLGVATNDFESVARQHLAGVLDLFDFVAGFDSGHGGKPEPGMLLAFARHCNLTPAQVLMVGDSRHDLIAGRAAGMATLAVLTGVAGAADLADLADAVRPDIGHIPELLGLG
ncbi:MAG: HAD family hydrolase [Rhodobacter sp.]|uniref:HAD family hydrolase n=1 Tax=Pararhodobacter sp. TaxID=2127056 RepID=UPI002D12F800|nr:HAD-IA family hydrolase [Pararhodobacter sp.]MCC0073621.1 HAD family hydrolase [Rhodobacter sp.]HPD91732.1 HAD-IA family hydrolase [Pararhodobacter sp.]